MKTTKIANKGEQKMENTESIPLKRVIEAVNKRMSAEEAGLVDDEALVMYHWYWTKAEETWAVGGYWPQFAVEGTQVKRVGGYRL